MGYTGKGIVITILDDGLEKDHPDLQANYVSFFFRICDFRRKIKENDKFLVVQKKKVPEKLILFSPHNYIPFSNYKNNHRIHWLASI